MAQLPDYVVRGAHVADELRLQLGLGIQPIGDLWQLIRDLDADLAFHGFGVDRGDGVYYWDGRRGLIVVNSDRYPRERQRFTAAHELGHHLLHRDDRGPLVVVEGDLFAGGEKPTEEREADAFASYLLAPTEAMRAAFDGKPARAITIEDIVDLMHAYGTTFQTTVYRLHNSGRIYAPDRDRLLAEAAGQIDFIREAKGFDREQLAPGHLLPPEHVLTALRMHESEVIDLERLAKLLRTSREEAAALVERARTPRDEQERAFEQELGVDLDEVMNEAE